MALQRAGKSPRVRYPCAGTTLRCWQRAAAQGSLLLCWRQEHKGFCYFLFCFFWVKGCLGWGGGGKCCGFQGTAMAPLWSQQCRLGRDTGGRWKLASLGEKRGSGNRWASKGGEEVGERSVCTGPHCKLGSTNVLGRRQSLPWGRETGVSRAQFLRF